MKEVEILVGRSLEPGSSKAVIFVEERKCYLRNWSKKFSRLQEILNPKDFLQDVALLVDHECLHQILYDIGEEEANHKLNNIDGFMATLVERIKHCYKCKGEIAREESCIIHLGCYWHKTCLKTFETTKQYKKLKAKVID
jgi:hypothetical protein